MNPIRVIKSIHTAAGDEADSVTVLLSWPEHGGKIAFAMDEQLTSISAGYLVGLMVTRFLSWCHGCMLHGKTDCVHGFSPCCASWEDAPVEGLTLAHVDFGTCMGCALALALLPGPLAAVTTSAAAHKSLA